MPDTQSNLDDLLPELFSEERRASRPPTMEEILAFLSGGLSPGAEEDLHSRLSHNPSATRLVLDLSDPSRLEGAEDETLLLPDPATLERKLRDEGLFDSGARMLPIRQGVHPLYRWAAAALLVLSTGLGIELARQPEQTSPQNVAVWEFLPRSGSEQRGGGEVVDAMPGFSHDLLLYSAGITRDSSFQVAVVGPEGKEALRRSVRTNVAGRLVLRLEETALRSGRYEIRLFAGGDPATPIAVYSLDWRRP